VSGSEESRKISTQALWGRILISDAILLPEKVERIYEETLSALNYRQQVLCGVGIRAIIETICKDKKESGKDLNEKIKSLFNIHAQRTWNCISPLEGGQVVHFTNLPLNTITRYFGTHTQ